jgi:hypothetical protein
MFSGAREGENGERVFSGYRAAVLLEKRILEISCTTL